VPKLWHQTIEAHRQGVQEAILNTTAALVAERGLRSVTMSEIAEATGIGRATLYKYYSSLEVILLAWHERRIAEHLRSLVDARDRASDPAERLHVVLETFAGISYEKGRHHGTDLAALVHQDETVARAQQQVWQLFRDVLSEAARAGRVRDDVPPDELATYCLDALSAATSLSSRAAVGRLVTVVMAGLRPPP
jgi:AcrR family transcriptional regulator